MTVKKAKFRGPLLVASISALALGGTALTTMPPSEGLSAEFTDTIAGGAGNNTTIGSGGFNGVSPSLTATRNGPLCDLTWPNPGAKADTSRITKGGESSYLWNGSPQGASLSGATANLIDYAAGPWAETYKLQHIFNSWNSPVSSATCLAWAISDNFNRAGALAGTTTTMGNASWLGGGSTNGNLATGGGIGLIKYGSANATQSVSVPLGTGGLVTRSNNAGTYVALKLSSTSTPYTRFWTESEAYSLYQQTGTTPVVNWTRCEQASRTPLSSYNGGPNPFTYYGTRTATNAPFGGVGQVLSVNPVFCKFSASESTQTFYTVDTVMIKNWFDATSQAACPVEFGGDNGWRPPSTECAQWRRTYYSMPTSSQSSGGDPIYGWVSQAPRYVDKTDSGAQTTWTLNLESYVNGALISTTPVGSGSSHTSTYDSPGSCVNTMTPPPGYDWSTFSAGSCTISSQGGPRSMVNAPNNLTLTSSGTSVTGSAVGGFSRTITNTNTDHTTFGYHGIVANAVGDYSLSGAAK